MLRTLGIIASGVALLSGSAFAQVGSPGLTPPKIHEPTQAEIEQQKAADKAYQSAVSRIPDPQTKTNDPWGDVRPPSPTVKKKPQ